MSVVTVEEVVNHLKKFGLISKLPEVVEGDASLRLKLERNKMRKLVFHRGNEIQDLKKDIKRRELFSVCGKLMGHYTIVGWLRTGCSFIKRLVEGVKWSDKGGREDDWHDARRVEENEYRGSRETAGIYLKQKRVRLV